MRQRLILTVPPLAAAETLAAACAAGDVAAAIIDADAPLAPDQAAAAAAGGAAALLRGAGWPLPFQADGLHAEDDLERLIRARPDGAICGAAAKTRHDAMIAGENAADYVWFDGAGDVVKACEYAAWWQALFEIPAVVAGPAASLAAMVETRAEFVAMVDAFGDGVDVTEAVGIANAALAAASDAGRTP